MMHWRERVKTLAGSLLEPNTKLIFKTNIFKKIRYIREYILYIARSILSANQLLNSGVTITPVATIKDLGVWTPTNICLKTTKKKGVALRSSQCFDSVMAQVHL